MKDNRLDANKKDLEERDKLVNIKDTKEVALNKEKNNWIPDIPRSKNRRRKKENFKLISEKERIWS